MLVLSERLDMREDLGDRLRERLQELIEEASGGSVEVDRTADGWMIINAEDEILLKSIIRLETKINPIASEKPPHLAYVKEVTETKIRVAYPTPRGESIQKAFSTKKFAATLGHYEEPLKDFLERIGIFRGSLVSISADAPSMLQLRFLQELAARGLDCLLILNMAPQEVESLLALQRVGALIASHQALTLTMHLLSIKLGVTSARAYERIRDEVEAISRDIVVKLLPWSSLSRLQRSWRLFE